MVISFVIYGVVIRCPQTRHKCNLGPVVRVLIATIKRLRSIDKVCAQQAARCERMCGLINSLKFALPSCE